MTSSFKSLTEVEPARPAIGDKPALSPVYRAKYSESFPTLPGINTLLDLFERSVEQYGGNKCLGERPVVNGAALPFSFLTYKQVAEEVHAVANAYIHLGLKAGQKVGVFGVNCKEWMIAMQGMNRSAIICVPLYETLAENAIEFILEHSEASLVVAAGSKLGALSKAVPKVKASPQGASLLTAGVVYWGDAKPDDIKALEVAGVTVRSWKAFTELGRANPAPKGAMTLPKPEDLCTIMYTSGTTGDPKGVMISHRAMVSHVASVKAFLAANDETMDQRDSYLSYLPLAHIFDRLVEEFMLHIGGSVGYWQGDIKKLVEDIGALQPTLFCGVPRVFERIYNGINDTIRRAGLISRLVFKLMYWRKLYFLKAGYRHDKASVVSDLLVFRKIKQRLGGKVRVILSGGAPLAAHIEEFLRVTMCAPVIQGYGLTETCAASFIASPFNFDQLGTVGCPMPVSEVRLEGVPDLEYSPTTVPPRGEVCIRGPGNFTGYYKNPQLTAEAQDEDGFFHTGDIGELLFDGTLKIIDRKKNLFKLSQGEYIAVEKVENVLKSSPVVEQLWVYGDSTQACLVAVVVPAHKELEEWAAKAGITAPTYEALCQTPEARQHVVQGLRASGKAGGLKGLEDIKAVYLDGEGFHIENDLMTPTFKLKRGPLLKKFKPQIDAMYRQLAASQPSGN